MNDTEKIGWTLRKYRRSKNLTQERLSTLSGRDRTYISNIENGKSDISMQAFLTLCEKLQIEPWRLIREALDS